MVSTLHLQKAQEALADLQREMSDLYKQQNNLTVRAPFAGKIIDVSKFTEGLEVSKGAKVCTLVNDKQLKLSLYFSYAYENDIYPGQSVTVSIPVHRRAGVGAVNGKELGARLHLIALVDEHVQDGAGGGDIDGLGLQRQHNLGHLGGRPHHEAGAVLQLCL